MCTKSARTSQVFFVCKQKDYIYIYVKKKKNYLWDEE